MDDIIMFVQNTTLMELHGRLLKLLDLPEDTTIWALYKVLLERFERK